jgi:hypothetical protein
MDDRVGIEQRHASCRRAGVAAAVLFAHAD